MCDLEFIFTLYLLPYLGIFFLRFVNVLLCIKKIRNKELAEKWLLSDF